MAKPRNTRSSSQAPPIESDSQFSLLQHDPITDSLPSTQQTYDTDHHAAQQQLQHQFPASTPTQLATPSTAGETLGGPSRTTFLSPLTRIEETPTPEGNRGVTTGAPPPPPPPTTDTAPPPDLHQSALKRALEDLLSDPAKRLQLL
ncbi:hypothetical protein BJ508DRAFT_335963, partial [Ascobolus immersus RN42]